jgi:hypothetical protein
MTDTQQFYEISALPPMEELGVTTVCITTAEGVDLALGQLGVDHAAPIDTCENGCCRNYVGGGLWENWLFTVHPVQFTPDLWIDDNMDLAITLLASGEYN